MKCQHCPKLATLQITEVQAENNFEEYHLCDECAQKYLYETSPKKKNAL
jgi:protein arginine kinase activator